jgi:DNA-directed RNA polymerase II subunit RPB1
MDNQLICQYNNISKITGIEFSILSNEQTKKISVITEEHGIDASDLHDSQEPQRGGLNDARLGTTSNDILCGTCKLNVNYCPGHFGHIVLGTHIFNYNYFNYIPKLLACICVQCAQILIRDKNIIDKIMKCKPIKRMRLIKGYSKNFKNCQNCNALIPKIKPHLDKKTSNLYLEFEYKTDDKSVNPIYNGDDIWRILNNISDENCLILGMNPEKSRPESMLVMNLPVPPIQMRPSSNKSDVSGGVYGFDGLTAKLAHIIKVNNTLNKDKLQIGMQNKKERDELLLQSHYVEYLKPNSDNDKDSAIKTKSLTQRLIGKQGRLRLTLSGKRVDFTGRTVITPGADLNVDEVGIPIMIAKKLTYPVMVTKYNIGEMRTLVARTEYPMAMFLWKYSTHNSDKAILPRHLQYSRENIEINIGDVIERNLITGDIIVFNRQPTLHKQSMMAHRVKIINDPSVMTARLPICLTTPYNADFDGDEMNIHAPQSEQTKIELSELAMVSKQLISAASSKTIYGIVQDGLIGSFILTDKNTKMSGHQLMDLISLTGVNNIQINKNKEYSGLDLINMILPEDYIKINYQLTKKDLGAQRDNSIIQILWDKYDTKTTMDFINNITRITNKFNMGYGYYIGIQDVIPKKETVETVHKTLETILLNIDYMITKFENNTDLITKEVYDNQIYDKLTAVRENVGNIIVENVAHNNAFNTMLKCGSKGEAINMGQLSGALGLQSLDGKTQPSTYNGRTSAYAYRYDDRAISKGLCTQSFLEGLKYQEFLAHTASSRTGLIESVIKTAKTGYMQRKLMKSLEDIIVKYDMTVRTAHDNIVQFVYGSTGADTTNQYKYELKILTMNNETIKTQYVFSEDETKTYKVSSKLNTEYYNYILTSRDKIRDLLCKTSNTTLIFEYDFLIPVNIRLIESEFKNIGKTNKTKTDLTYEYIIDKIQWVLNNKNTILLCGKNKDDAGTINKTIFSFILHTVLAPKRIMHEFQLTKEIFDKYIQVIVNKFNKNLVHPCSTIGCLAAQSIGEPLTQLTLKAFHKIGQPSVSNTVQGVPRTEELLSISKTPKDTQMTVILKDEYKNNKEIAEKIASYIKYTTFGEIRGQVDVFYDPLNEILKDEKINTSFCDKNTNIANYPWLYKIEILKDKILEKFITLLDIKSKLCNWWVNKTHADLKNINKEEKRTLTKISQMIVMSSDENADKLYIYIRVNGKDVIKNTTKEIDEFNMNTLIVFMIGVMDNIKLKGIPKIYNINSVSDENMIVFDKNTGDMKTQKQWVIYTGGVNLEDIRNIHGIDLNASIANNVYEMYLKYGIEIARNVLMNEMIISIKTAGGYINYHHIALIIDMMTMTGDIVPIDRNGINKSDGGPLTRASYEKVVEQFINASIYNEVDDIKGMSAQIMVGQMISGGTGGFDIQIDAEELAKYNIETNDEQIVVGENQLITDIIHNDQNIDFFVPDEDDDYLVD